MTTGLRSRAALSLGGVGLIVGMVAGFALGTIFAGRFWTDFLSPDIAAPGNQAYSVLTLLDSNQLSRLRGMMEAQVDSTLDYLESRRRTQDLAQGSPEWKIYERLKRYRETHQRVVRASSYQEQAK